MWILTCFCHLFLLNETVRFVQNVVVSYIVQRKKKRPKRCRFEQNCGSSSSPGRARQGKKHIFLPPVFIDFYPIPLSLKHQKDADHNPTCINSDSSATTGWWKTEGTCPSSGFWGSCTVATPASPPLFFTYKYRGDKDKERESTREGGRPKKEEAEKGMKNQERERKEKKQRKKRRKTE